MMGYMNGTGAASPDKPSVLLGVSVAHWSKVNKAQKAVVAADIVDGRAVFQPTVRQLAAQLGVSANYITAARRLSPKARAALLADRDPNLPRLLAKLRQSTSPSAVVVPLTVGGAR